MYLHLPSFLFQFFCITTFGTAVLAEQLGVLVLVLLQPAGSAFEE